MAYNLLRKFIINNLITFFHDTANLLNNQYFKLISFNSHTILFSFTYYLTLP